MQVYCCIMCTVFYISEAIFFFFVTKIPLACN